mgnify:CR=1 FL=1
MRKLIYTPVLLLVCIASKLYAQREFEINIVENASAITILDIKGDIEVKRSEEQVIKVAIALYKDSKFYGKADIPKSIEVVENGPMVKLKGISDDSNRKYQLTIPMGWPLKFNLKNNLDELTIIGNKTPLEVKSKGCDISLIDNSGPISISTTHGDVFVSWDNAMLKSDSYITTVSGEIEMEVDEQSSFGFEIRPYQGSIENTLNMKLSYMHNLKIPKAFEGNYNNGSAKIFLETTVGDIILKEK